jgi:hypothetical protein
VPTPRGNQCVCLGRLWVGRLEENQLRLGVGVFGPERPRISQNNGADLLWQQHGTDIPSPQMQDSDILWFQSQSDDLCFGKVNLR